MCKLNVVRKIMKNRLALAEIDEVEADYILSYELNIPITEVKFSTMDLSKNQYNSVIKKLKQKKNFKKLKQKHIKKI